MLTFYNELAQSTNKDSHEHFQSISESINLFVAVIYTFSSNSLQLRTLQHLKRYNFQNSDVKYPQSYIDT